MKKVDRDIRRRRKHDTKKRCSVLQCVAVCCRRRRKRDPKTCSSALQCVAVRRIMLQYVADIDVSVTQKEDFK